MFIKSVKQFLNKPIPAIELSNDDKVFLGWLSCLVGFYILPIILADFYFVDDWYRSVNGLDWNANGRWFQTAFYRFLSPIALLDLSPFTQIVAGIFLIFSGFFIYKRLLIDIPVKIASIICFIFIANPYFLENLSYRFDSVGMSMAIFLNCLAFYLVTDRSSLIKYAIATIIIMGALCTYQISFLIFVGLVSFSFVKNVLEKQNYKENMRMFVSSIAILLLPISIYYLALNPLLSDWVEWTYNFDIFSIKQNGFLLTQIFKNKVMVVFFVVPAIIACVGYLIISLKAIRIDNNRDVVSIINKIIAVLFPIIIFFISSINLFVFTNQIYPRMYYGFALLLLFMGYYFYKFFEIIELKRLSLMMLLPAMYLMINSYTYSNFQKTVFRDITILSNYIIADLKPLDVIDKKKDFIIKGKMPYSPQADRLRKYLLLDYPDFAFHSGWFSRYIFAYSSAGMVGIDINILDGGDNYDVTGANVLKDSKIYSIKEKNKLVVIEFKNNIKH